MSRIRIVKGKITEIVGGDLTYFSESNISEYAAEVYSENSKKVIKHSDNPEKPPAGKIIAKCMVQFRPHANWKGEYGFDWVRLGDTGTKGDTWYKSIIGKYKNPATKALQQIYTNGVFFSESNEYQKLLNKFNNMIIPWKPKINGKPYLYSIPYMTIYKGDTHKLSLKVEIDELPQKLTVKHERKVHDKNIYFKFNKTEVTKKKGKYTLENYLEITCLKSFSTDQTIEILADDIVCGKLKILANDSSHQKNSNVLFVKVISSAGSGNINGEATRLKNYMKQAYINISIKNLNLNLSNDANFIPKLKSNSGIHQYLDAKLRGAKFPDGSKVGSKYDNYYRVYFISEVISLSNGAYLLGQADNIPSKTVFVLNLQATATAAGVSFETVKTTATHELLHAIGLYHTFDNSSPLTFKKFNTDNIMDYYSPSTAIVAKQTYKWQWEILKNKI